MGKVKTPKRAGSAPSSPYDRNSSTSKPSGAPKNNVFKFNKDFGQHILKNPSVSDQIVAKADLKPTDTVLEVGPGTGNLTVRILEKARKVIAVELDPRMAAEVTKRVQGTPLQKKLEVLLGDVIKMDLPPFDVLISNTPYQISSPLIFKILALPNPPRTSILMFQREFAMRLTARSGDALFNRLSVNSQFWARCTHIMKVGRNNFRPPPQVDSSVVRIEPKLGKDRPNISFEEFDGMLRFCFNRKNKTLRASWFTKEVLAIVEKNYRIYCAMNNIPIEEGVAEGGEDADDDDDMDVDNNTGSRGAAPDAEEEWGGIMDVDDDTPELVKQLEKSAAANQLEKTPSRRKKTKMGVIVREKIRKVLEDVTELADKRSSKCDENDFLKLLFAFNSEGIHFA